MTATSELISGFEPETSSLPRKCSTPELHQQLKKELTRFSSLLLSLLSDSNQRPRDYKSRALASWAKEAFPKRVSWLCRTATTTYPCCLPTLGGFCRSWSHRTYPGTKVQKSSQLPNVFVDFYRLNLGCIFNILDYRKLFVDEF